MPKHAGLRTPHSGWIAQGDRVAEAEERAIGEGIALIPFAYAEFDAIVVHYGAGRDQVFRFTYGARYTDPSGIEAKGRTERRYQRNDLVSLMFDYAERDRARAYIAAHPTPEAPVISDAMRYVLDRYDPDMPLPGGRDRGVR